MIKAILFIWQLPQHIVALIYYLWLLMDKSVVRKEKHDGYTIIFKDTYDNVALGQYVFAWEDEIELKIMHETGHVKQSKMLGPLYLFVIGIPSGLWNLTHESICPRKSYYWFYPEAWANRLAGIKF